MARCIILDHFVPTPGYFQGEINCNSNPDFPPCEAGKRYVVTGSGLIGGSTGHFVMINDFIVCKHACEHGGSDCECGQCFDIIHTNIQLESGKVTTDVSGMASVLFKEKREFGPYIVNLSCDDTQNIICAYVSNRTKDGFEIYTRHSPSGHLIGGIDVSWIALNNYNL